MPRKQPAETAADEPVLHTPRGASPRALRSDAFEGRPATTPPAVRELEEPEEQSPAVPASDAPAEAPERDWDFGVPEPGPPRPADSLLDPDVNWRHQAGLRAPLETAPIPRMAREKFSENWERLAADPPRDGRSRVRRGLERSILTRWMFSDGRFDIGAAVGPLLLLALLIAAFIYGWRVLGGQDRKAPPATETPAVKSN